MTGFVDLGDVNNHLAAFERSLEEDGTSAQTLAKSMLVLMIRGLFSGLQFPYAQFPCCSLKGSHMFHIVWAAVGRLDRYGFRVVALTCDGLAANRQLFRLHGPKSSQELLYKTANPFSNVSRMIFFLSDPITSSKPQETALQARTDVSGYVTSTLPLIHINHAFVLLQFDQPISWSHIADLYHDATSGKEAPGFSHSKDDKFFEDEGRSGCTGI